jgi:hypothetical protein
MVVCVFVCEMVDRSPNFYSCSYYSFAIGKLSMKSEKKLNILGSSSAERKGIWKKILGTKTTFFVAIDVSNVAMVSIVHFHL